MATAIKRSPSQVSQWLNSSPDSRTQKPRTISNASARYIEQQCERKHGWMDQPIDRPQTPPPPDSLQSPALPANRADVTLPANTDPPSIAAVVALMRSTDDTGRAMVLGAAKAALAGYQPGHQSKRCPVIDLEDFRRYRMR